MAKTGKTIATFIIGAVVGAAAGYLVATDKERRKDQMDAMKDKFSHLKSKFGKKTTDLEEDIYNA